MKINNDLIVTRMLLLDKELSKNENKVLLRVVYIDSFSSSVSLCRIDDDSWPFPVSMDELAAEMDPEHGRYTVELSDPYDGFVIEKSNPKIEALHKHRYELIEPLITGDNERLILMRNSRKRLIRERLKEVKDSYSTIVNMLMLYWKRGMTYQALRPDYHKCGKIKDPKQVRKIKETRKLGAPRKISPGTGINIIGDYNKKAIERGAAYWIAKKKITLKDAHDKMVRLFFSKKIKDEKGKIIGYEIEPDNKPTMRQLQYYIHQKYPHGKIRRRRHGQKNWDGHERPLLGKADGDVYGPGDRFQIDATVADVYLVSSFDRRRIVGRPVIYFVVDVYSRLITGVYVGFEGPSWVGAMMALANMVMPKVEFCKTYDIEIEPDEWPSHHAPRKIMGDRGELVSVDLGRNIIQNLKIEIENASPGRGDLKPIVERQFGTVPAKFRPFTDGYVEKDFNQRGAEDYRLSATLNLYEFTQLVILAVLERNSEPIGGIDLPPEMISDALTASPLDIWEWGIANRSGSLKLLTLDQVRLNVMPMKTATITGSGIYVNKAFYSCATAVRDEWFSKGRLKKWKVDVSYDPRDLSIVYLRDPSFEKGYEVCRLLEKSSSLVGKSLFEYEELGYERKKVEAAGENDRQAKRLLFDKRATEIQSRARKATKAVQDPNISNAARTAGIRSNKAEEKDFHRNLESFALSDLNGRNDRHDQSRKKVDNSDDYRDREFAALEAKRKQREGK